MAHPERNVSRRGLLRAGLAGSAALATGGLGAQPTVTPSPELTPASAPLPTRPLGRSGVQVPILAIGGAMENQSLELLEQAWDRGIRYFDTAHEYERYNGRGEAHIGDFLRKHPERREHIFLATKELFPGRSMNQLRLGIDERLRKCGTDYIDLLFIHAMSADYGENSHEWLRGDELRGIAEELKAAGKIRLFGFTSHAGDRGKYLLAAAEGGFVDATMVSYSPLFQPRPRVRGGFNPRPDEDLVRGIEACHQAGIGLIAMKTMRVLGHVARRHPEFDARDLTVRQAMFHALWADKRFASVCSEMRNAEELDENTAAARRFAAAPEAADVELLERLVADSGPSMCPNCDGSCRRAAGTAVALDDIARYVTYYEREGARWAGELYRRLPEGARSPAGADLNAAREACHCHLDFARILEKADRYFA